MATDNTISNSEATGILDLCTCSGEGTCFACDPDYLDKCAARRGAGNHKS